MLLSVAKFWKYSNDYSLKYVKTLIWSSYYLLYWNIYYIFSNFGNNHNLLFFSKYVRAEWSFSVLIYVKYGEKLYYTMRSKMKLFM